MGLFGLGGDKLRRKPLSAYDKQTVLARQDYRCAKCSSKFTTRIRPHFDHRKPLSEGGSNELSNIRAICANCHDHKSRKENKTRAIKKQQKRNDDPFGVGSMFGSSTSRKKRKDDFWGF